MTVESDILSTLGGLVSSRVYPDVAPDFAVKPFITYQQIGGKPANFLAGIPSKKNGRFQISVWATTRVEAMDLIRQVEDSLRTSMTATTEGGAVSLYDEETKLRGARQDFSIWF